MKYTNYFLEQTNTHHPEVTLSNSQKNRILEIVKAECIWATTGDPTERYVQQKRINKLTNRSTPEKLWAEMLRS